MRYFPAFLDLEEQDCLMVGGGALAARKARALRKAGARITVVAPRIGPAMSALAGRGEVSWLARAFLAEDVCGRVLVQSATGRAAVDRRVSAAARGAGIPVNVVDQPALSSFVMPAVVDRDPIVIGISTGGAAPMLARRLRARIERMLPARIGRLARFAERFRGAVKANFTEGDSRLRFWERFFEGAVAEQVLAGDERAAAEAMLALVNRAAARAAEPGVVHIVGAGPGDPDLLTLRALRLIQQAEVLVHDRLVGPEILDYARRDAELIDAGKTKGRHSKPQSEINALMAHHAAAGRRVVRLKGGDPFVFGRGGEELDYLRRRGVRTEVVPGITAATGCAAYAGLPLTHRDYAAAVTFITGHARNGEPKLDWPALATGRQTLVVYMGLTTAGLVARRLMQHGLDPTTPAAVIENGTRPDQRLAVGTVATLEALIADHAIAGPALIVIGEVVRLAGAVALPERARAALG